MTVNLIIRKESAEATSCSIRWSVYFSPKGGCMEAVVEFTGRGVEGTSI
jgi:hypothetical protein